MANVLVHSTPGVRVVVSFLALLLIPAVVQSDCASYCEFHHQACAERSDTSCTAYQICVQQCISTGAGAGYGAIAYSPSTDAIGYSYDYDLQDQAEDRAMSECGEADCEIVVWFSNACGALATDGNGIFSGDWAESREEAQAKAIRSCSRNTTGTCELRQTVCAN